MVIFDLPFTQIISPGAAVKLFFPTIQNKGSELLSNQVRSEYKHKLKY